MKEPARLDKRPDNNVSPLFIHSWMFLHPAAIIITLLIGAVLLSSLVFALNGGCALESGGLRNFLANGI